MFTIEKNIPFQLKQNKRAEIEEALNKMQIGDSVLVKQYSKANHFYVIAKSIAMKTKNSKVEGGYRVWRIE